MGKLADAIRKEQEKKGGEKPPIKKQIPAPQTGRTLQTPSAAPAGPGVGPVQTPPPPARSTEPRAKPPQPAPSTKAAAPVGAVATPQKGGGLAPLPQAKQRETAPAGIPMPPSQKGTVITPPLNDEQKKQAENELHLNLAKTQLGVVKEEVLQGKYDDALRDAKEIKVEGVREEAYAVVAREKAKIGEDEDAKKIARNIRNNALHAAVLKDIAEKQQGAGKVVESKVTLKKAKRLANRVPDTVAERKSIIEEVDDLNQKAEKRIEGNEDLKTQEKRMKRNRLLRWLGPVVGLMLTSAIGVLLEKKGDAMYDWTSEKITQVVIGKDNLEKLKKMNGKKETAPVEETAEAEQEVVSLLSPEEAAALQNYLDMGFPIAKNPEIDVDKLRAYRPVDDIEEDIDALKAIIEKGKNGKAEKELKEKVTMVYLKEEKAELEQSKKAKETEVKRLGEEVKELDKKITEMEAQEADEGKIAKLKEEKSDKEWEISGLEGNILDIKEQIENIDKALKGEDKVLLAEKEAEALDAKLKILQAQKIENEKLHAYLESEEGMKLTKDTYCPSEGVVTEGNDRCDKQPDLVLIGKDNKVILVLNPYYVESHGKNGVCSTDCKAGGSKDAWEKKTW